MPVDAAYLAVARITRPHGRRGEVAAEILTDFPERFAGLRQAYLEVPGGEPQEAALESARPHKGRMILKFAGVESIPAAEGLRGRHVLIPKQDRVRLTEGYYYLWELEGCRVVRAAPSPESQGSRAEGATEEVGRVTSVEPTAGVALLHVSTAKGEVLIPFAEEICTKINEAAKMIWIEPPADLLELNS